MPKYWCGDVPTKDDFGIPIEHTPGSVFYDGKTMSGPWGIMTLGSWALDGCGRLGPGFGQMYECQKNGRWKKIDG